MITEHMTLTTRADARLWASQMLDGVDGVGDAEIDRLADYLWDHFPRQTYAECRDDIPTDDEFWAIVWAE